MYEPGLFNLSEQLERLSRTGIHWNLWSAMSTSRRSAPSSSRRWATVTVRRADGLPSTP